MAEHYVLKDVTVVTITVSLCLKKETLIMYGRALCLKVDYVWQSTMS
jgi:hypothetical protein